MPLTARDEDVRDRGLVLILGEHHDAIDAAVAAAYGWPAAAGTEEVLSRLVVLNRERRGEEARGALRWLRPDYQRPRFGEGGGMGEQIAAADRAERGGRSASSCVAASSACKPLSRK